jgi:hypothetical protein
MIGLANLPNGPHHLRLLDEELFILVRRRRIVYAESWFADGGKLAWRSSAPGIRAEQIVTGLQALAEKVVMPAG